jgi:hypothetical protein
MHRHINERYKIYQEKAKHYCNENETKITKQNKRALIISASEVTYTTLIKQPDQMKFQNKMETGSSIKILKFKISLYMKTVQTTRAHTQNLG